MVEDQTASGREGERAAAVLVGLNTNHLNGEQNENVENVDGNTVPATPSNVLVYTKNVLTQETTSMPRRVDTATRHLLFKYVIVLHHKELVQYIQSYSTVTYR